MSEDLSIVAGSKTEQYESLLPQIAGLLEGEPDLIANLANTVGALKEQFGWLWVGFYLVKPSRDRNTDQELVLGPFQGPVACTRIKKGTGVCGRAWQQEATVIVADVSKFPGHIACSSFSRSEIVVPVLCEGQIIGVLDVDSDMPDAFDAIDQRYLERIVAIIPF
jgi:L-methionine (R)-S-oxide reductase